MIDTVRLETPFIDELTAKSCTINGTIRKAVKIKDDNTEETIYQFTNAELKGSYDSMIKVEVKRKKWIRLEGLKMPVCVDCPPYLVIECSVHKVFFGTNCIKGFERHQYAIYMLKRFIEKSFRVILPALSQWELIRIDYAKNYHLGSTDEKKNYLMSLNHGAYPRRHINRYGDTGIHIPGDSTTFKVYDKYSDFLKHDKKRLKQQAIIDFGLISRIESEIKDIVRIEVEVKAKKLKYDLKKDFVSIFDIDKSYLEDLFMKEVEKVIKITRESQELYYKNDDVMQILKVEYGTRKANSLYSFWVQYQTMGEKYIRQHYSKTTFYRMRKELKDLNISLVTSDIKVEKIESKFKPTLQNCVGYSCNVIDLYNSKIKFINNRD